MPVGRKRILALKLCEWKMQASLYGDREVKFETEKSLFEPVEAVLQYDMLVPLLQG